jgi:diacylglycerol kinase family enzyme
MKIGVLLNRNAGRHRLFRRRLAEDLRAALEKEDLLAETWHVDQIKDTLVEFRKAGVDTLAIAGGDGSNHYVLSAAVEVFGQAGLPRVALLCGGTHNAHALSIGVRGAPRSLLQRLVAARRNGHRPGRARRVLLRLSDARRVWHGFTMATGFMHRFYQEMLTTSGDDTWQALKMLGGWTADVIKGGKRLKQVFQTESGRVDIEGAECPFSETNGVACSAMEKLGLGFTPFPLASVQEGHFQVAVSRIRPGALLKIMHRWWRGRLPEHPDVFVTHTARVLLPDRPKIGFVLDGELYQAEGWLSIQAGPLIDFILP